MTELRKVIAWLSSYCTVDEKQKISGSNVDYGTASHSPEPTQVFTPQGLKIIQNYLGHQTYTRSTSAQ